jgi:hypothetical protein
MEIEKCKMQNAKWSLTPAVHYSICIFQFAFCILPFSSCISSSYVFAADDRKVVIPFDFVSRFDNGDYGRRLGDMFWAKLSRQGMFILPESMLEVRDYCASHGLRPSPELSLEKMKKIVQDDFGAQIGIWGSVERAPGTEAEIYDLVIKCVDFSAQPHPKVLYEVKTRTNSVAEIPHLYVKQALDALYGRKPGGPAITDSIAEDNWKHGPNLVIGDFQRGSGGVPDGWDRVCGQKREPLGRLVRWVAEEENSSNRVVRFTFDKAVAEFEGVMYYSDWFPVEEGAKYRFQCRWRSKGPAVKVFVKCYDQTDSQYGPESKQPGRAAGGRKPGKDDYVPEYAQRREVYRSQQNLSDGAVNTWTWKTHTEDFVPRHVKYTPRWGRVMLYAYMVPGVVEFDDVVVKQIVPAPSGQPPKVRRHSTDTKITIKEMEENERRSRELKTKGKKEDNEPHTPKAEEPEKQ